MEGAVRCPSTFPTPKTVRFSLTQLSRLSVFSPHDDLRVFNDGS